MGRWCWLDAVEEDFASVEANFHAMVSSCFLQPFSELLQFFFGDHYRQQTISRKAFSDDGVKFFCVFCIIFSMNMLNSTGDNENPCCTPTVVSIHNMADRQTDGNRLPTL